MNKVSHTAFQIFDLHCPNLVIIILLTLYCSSYGYPF